MKANDRCELQFLPLVCEQNYNNSSKDICILILVTIFYRTNTFVNIIHNLRVSRLIFFTQFRGFYAFDLIELVLHRTMF